MSDITICINEACPRKDVCYRYQAVWSEYWQSVCVFVPEGDTSCEHFSAIQKGDRLERDVVRRKDNK